MLFIISLFLIVASEWVGNITLSPSMKTYSSIRLVTSLPNWPLVLNLPICQFINLTTNCTDKAIIISETTNIIETLESSTPSIVIIIRNNHRTIISDALIFEISEKNTEGLLNTTDSSLQILFDYNFHCDELSEAKIITISSLVLWSVGIFLWIRNNSHINRLHSELFHKFSTGILICKALNSLTNVLLFMSCPFERQVLAEILNLLCDQTRSLYETAFFAYLLLLSKGFLLTVNTIDQRESNYLIIIVIIVYILDSALNIFGSGFGTTTMVMYMLVICHCISFSISTFRAFNTQIEIIRETGMDFLLSITLGKKRLFLIFFGFTIVYFIEEFLIHNVIDISYSSYSKMDYHAFNWFCFLHEIIEIVTVGSIFYLYRARNLGRFATIEIDRISSLGLVLPFYESNSQCEEGLFATISMPGKKILLGKLD